jgi:hypothetical protein
MIKNLKVFGLAVMAVLALGAVVANAAMAEKFHSEVAATTLSGAQTSTHEFVTNAGTVTCTTAKFAGSTTTKEESSLQIKPTYETCKLSGIGIEVTVNSSATNYKFLEPTLKSGKINIITGSIVVSGPGCTITVPTQENLGSVSYANEGTGTSRTVKVTAAVTGIHYTGSGLLCSGIGSQTNGQYKGPTSVKGLNSGGTQVGIWVE